MESEDSLPLSQVPVTSPYLKLSFQSTLPHPTSCKSILILYSHSRLGLPIGLFPSCFPTKTLYTLSSLPYMLHVPLISFFSIWSPKQYRARSTNPYWMVRNIIHFYGQELSAPCQTPKQEDHSLSAVRDCLLNKFSVTLILEAVPPSSTCRRAMPLWKGPTYHGVSYIYDF